MRVGRLLVLLGPILQLIKGHRATDTVLPRMAAAKFMQKAQLCIWFHPLCDGGN